MNIPEIEDTIERTFRELEKRGANPELLHEFHLAARRAIADACPYARLCVIDTKDRPDPIGKIPDVIPFATILRDGRVMKKDVNGD